MYVRSLSTTAKEIGLPGAKIRSTYPKVATGLEPDAEQEFSTLPFDHIRKRRLGSRLEMAKNLRRDSILRKEFDVPRRHDPDAVLFPGILPNFRATSSVIDASEDPDAPLHLLSHPTTMGATLQHPNQTRIRTQKMMEERRVRLQKREERLRQLEADWAIQPESLVERKRVGSENALNITSGIGGSKFLWSSSMRTAHQINFTDHSKHLPRSERSKADQTLSFPRYGEFTRSVDLPHFDMTTAGSETELRPFQDPSF